MANLSSFPNQIDTFLQRHELTANDLPAVARFQELKLKSSRTPSEESELASITAQLRDKLIASDDFNKLQDAMVNMEQFLITEINDYVTAKQAEISATKDAALILIEQKKANIIDYMDGTTAGAIRNDMGDLTTLTTTDKTSLVNAIKENTASISTVNSALSNKAPLASPAFTGNPTTPTPAFNDNDTTVANTAFVMQQIGMPIAYGTTSGTNTYAVSPTPLITAYADGTPVSIKIGTTNTAASTLNVNGLGAKSIKDSKGNTMVAGKLRAGSIYTLRYNGTDFILQGEGASGNATASDLLSGKTASTDAGDITGNIPVNGALNYNPSTASQTVPAGYTTGGTINPVGGNANPQQVLSGYGFSSSVGIGMTGSMPVINQRDGLGQNHVPTTAPVYGVYTSGNTNKRVYLPIPTDGFYQAGSYLVVDQNELDPSNVRSGLAYLGGAVGMLDPKLYATGSVGAGSAINWNNFNGSNVGTWNTITVSGLGFTPKLVMCVGPATNYQMSIWNNGIPWVQGATTLPANGIIIVNSNFYNFNLESGGWVNSGGFRMPIFTGSATWYAWG